MANATIRAMIAAARSTPPPAAISLDSLVDYARDRLQAAASYPSERLQRRDFALAALDLTLWSSSDALPDLFQKSSVPRPDRDSAVPAHARIFALSAEMEGWDPPLAWNVTKTFTSRRFDRTLADAELRGFYYHDEPSWQLFDPVSGTGVATLPTPLGIPPWESSSPLRLFLHWAYSAADLRLTHAATLGLKGRGALIAGASGSGKSGTTLAGLMNGLDSVGDDYVLLEPGVPLIAYPVFCTLKQDAEGLRRAGLPETLLDGASLNWHGKFEFDVTRVAPQGFVDHLEIAAILIPEIARLPRTKIEPAARRDGALSLVPSSVLQLPGDGNKGFHFLSEVVRRLPAFRLRLSEDPAEIAGAIASFLSHGAWNAG
jgi:hypothetical protein